MQTRGAIYHHKDMVFNDGGNSNKYLILLNTPDKKEPYLFVKTTSRQKRKSKTPGCIDKDVSFFIQAGKTFFPIDTWVLLHQIYEISPTDVDGNSNIRIVGSLDHKVIDDIVNCLFRIRKQDISGFHQKLLAPPINESILKLKGKWEGGKTS